MYFHPCTDQAQYTLISAGMAMLFLFPQKLNNTILMAPLPGFLYFCQQTDKHLL